MAFNFMWLSGDPEVEKHLQKANEERSAAFYAASSLVAHAVSAPIRRLFVSIRNARRVGQARRELSALSNHLLTDIGITRDEIPAVAEALAAKTPKSGLTVEQLGDAEATDFADSQILAVPASGKEHPLPGITPRSGQRPIERPAARERRPAA